MYMEVFDVSKILLKCLQMSMWLLFQHSCLFAPKIIRHSLFALCDMCRKYVKLTPLETCQKIMTDLCYMHYTETHAHIHRIQMRVQINAIAFFFCFILRLFNPVSKVSLNL